VSTWITPVLTGSFALVGGLGGVFLSNHFTNRVEERRTANEDARRWLSERRHVYAKYLALVASMMKDISTWMVFLPQSEDQRSLEDVEYLKERVFDFYSRWDDELQPALEEVQLLANKKVAELADRTSWALLEMNGFLDSNQLYDEVFEYDGLTRHLIKETRNAMRAELGLAESLHTYPMPDNWPWLPLEVARPGGYWTPDPSTEGADDASTSPGDQMPPDTTQP
jgi:regulator of sigma D